jgi:hypothetical protein
MDNRKYIGMDVHQASISIAVSDAAGKVLMECIIETKAAAVLEFIQGLCEWHSHPIVRVSNAITASYHNVWTELTISTAARASGFTLPFSTLLMRE